MLLIHKQDLNLLKLRYSSFNVCCSTLNKEDYRILNIELRRLKMNKESIY